MHKFITFLVLGFLVQASAYADVQVGQCVVVQSNIVHNDLLSIKTPIYITNDLSPGAIKHRLPVLNTFIVTAQSADGRVQLASRPEMGYPTTANRHILGWASASDFAPVALRHCI